MFSDQPDRLGTPQLTSHVGTCLSADRRKRGQGRSITQQCQPTSVPWYCHLATPEKKLSGSKKLNSMNWRGGEKNIESSDGTTALKSHKLKVDTRKGLLIRINPISFLTPQTPSKEVHSTKYKIQKHQIQNTKYTNK